MEVANDAVSSLQNWFEPAIYGALILLGLVSVFWGKTLIKAVIILMASLTLASSLAYLGYNQGGQAIVWSVGGFVVGALAGGLLALFFFNLAIAMVGALAAGLLILPIVIEYPTWIQLGILGAGCGFAALVSLVVTQLMIKLGTAMAGGFLVSSGVFFFINGTRSYELIQLDGQSLVRVIPNTTLTLVAIGIGLIGFVFQSKGKFK